MPAHYTWVALLSPCHVPLGEELDLREASSHFQSHKVPVSEICLTLNILLWAPHSFIQQIFTMCWALCYGLVLHRERDIYSPARGSLLSDQGGLEQRETLLGWCTHGGWVACELGSEASTGVFLAKYGRMNVGVRWSKCKGLAVHSWNNENSFLPPSFPPAFAFLSEWVIHSQNSKIWRWRKVHSEYLDPSFPIPFPLALPTLFPVPPPCGHFLLSPKQPSTFALCKC